jgi:hypothetical protein
MTFCAVAALALAGVAADERRPRCWERRVYRHVAQRLSRSAEMAEEESDGGGDDGVVVGWCDGDAWCPSQLHRDSPAVVRTDVVLGFQGRPGKPCDSCYKHWLGGVLGVLFFSHPPTPPPLPVHACRSGVLRHGSRGIGRDVGAPPDFVYFSLGLSGALMMTYLALLEPQSSASSSEETHKIRQVLQMSPPHPIFGCSLPTARRSGLIA